MRNATYCIGRPDYEKRETFPDEETFNEWFSKQKTASVWQKRDDNTVDTSTPDPVAEKVHEIWGQTEGDRGVRVIDHSHFKDIKEPLSKGFHSSADGTVYELIRFIPENVNEIALGPCNDDGMGYWTIPASEITGCKPTLGTFIDTVNIGKDRVNVYVNRNTDGTLTQVLRDTNNPCRPTRVITGGRAPVDDTYIVIQRGEEICVFRNDEFDALREHTPRDKSVDFQKFLALDDTMYRDPKQRVLQSLKTP